jgi:hypothetical protein
LRSNPEENVVGRSEVITTPRQPLEGSAKYRSTMSSSRITSDERVLTGGLFKEITFTVGNGDSITCRKDVSGIGEEAEQLRDAIQTRERSHVRNPATRRIEL